MPAQLLYLQHTCVIITYCVRCHVNWAKACSLSKIVCDHDSRYPVQLRMADREQLQIDSDESNESWFANNAGQIDAAAGGALRSGPLLPVQKSEPCGTIVERGWE